MGVVANCATKFCPNVTAPANPGLWRRPGGTLDDVIPTFATLPSRTPQAPFTVFHAAAAVVGLLTGRHELISLDGVDPALFPEDHDLGGMIAWTGEVAAVMGSDRLWAERGRRAWWRMRA